VKSSTCTHKERVWNINHVWFITPLLLDELWTSTCLAKSVKIVYIERNGNQISGIGRLAGTSCCLSTFHTAKHIQNQGLVQMKQRILAFCICLGTNSTLQPGCTDVHNILYRECTAVCTQELRSGKRQHEWNLSRMNTPCPLFSELALHQYYQAYQLFSVKKALQVWRSFLSIRCRVCAPSLVGLNGRRQFLHPHSFALCGRALRVWLPRTSSVMMMFVHVRFSWGLVQDVTTYHGTSLSMDYKFEP
jgi:hypothetical protein